MYRKKRKKSIDLELGSGFIVITESILQTGGMKYDH